MSMTQYNVGLLKNLYPFIRTPSGLFKHLPLYHINGHCGNIMGPPKGGSGAMCYVPKSLACYVLCKFLFTLLCEIQKGCYAEVQPVLCAM